MQSSEELKNIASQVRRDIIRMVTQAKSGHPGGSMSSADFLTALYFNVMDQNPSKWTRDGKDQDMFFLSAGHLTVQASGSLGQGLSAAIGAALSKKLDKDPRTVFVMCGDGESEEGQIWEAAMFAPHHKVDNLIAMTDWNHKQIDGDTEDVAGLGDLEAKWKAFGWDVIVAEGNDMDKVLAAFADAKSRLGKGKPVMMLFKTEMGHGVDFMAGTHKWHGSAPSEEQCAEAMKQLKETLGDF